MPYQTEKTVETKTCAHCGTHFDVTDKDLEFYDKISPVFGGKRYTVPTPKFCPDCRAQRRYSFRNERMLYKRKCALTGREIVSMYSPDKAVTVYNHHDWFGDKWNAMDY